MSSRSDNRPPSPPRSPEGGTVVLPTTEELAVQQLHTPPGLLMSAPADEYSYDPYGDPAMHHTSAPQPYYQPDPWARYNHQYQTPPPASYTQSGIQTRSGRSLISPQSPRRRVQSPNKRAPKKKAVKVKTSGPQLEEPLSVLTKDYTIPVRDMAAWVNRPVEDRLKETAKKSGYVSRPMNSFMLYRSAYAERVKQFCKEGNHQIVSQVTGASWPLEPESIRKEYERLSILERDNHAAAHPNYKFTPNKNGKKRARANNDDESDGEWGGSSRTKRSRTAASSRYGDSRSNTGTPFDDRYYPGSYSPAPMQHVRLNPSSYQYHYPNQYPPAYHQDGYPDGFIQTRISEYGPGIEDVHYINYRAQMLAQQQQQQQVAVVGMPSGENHGLLVPDDGGVGIGMLDPRLGGTDYEAPESYGHAAPEAYHPGQATLTEGWAQQEPAGAAFDQVFESLNYE